MPRLHSGRSGAPGFETPVLPSSRRPVVAGNGGCTGEGASSSLRREERFPITIINRFPVMPNVGLFSAAEPLSSDMKVSIRYTVEVDGLPVYTELYDADKLAEELERDEEAALELWARRVKAVVECRKQTGFSACVTGFLADGVCRAHGDAMTTAGEAE